MAAHRILLQTHLAFVRLFASVCTNVVPQVAMLSKPFATHATSVKRVLHVDAYMTGETAALPVRLCTNIAHERPFITES